MNDKIKTILEKHIDVYCVNILSKLDDFNSAIIEICEDQKKNDAKSAGEVSLSAEWEILNNSKNIAQ